VLMPDDADQQAAAAAVADSPSLCLLLSSSLSIMRRAGRRPPVPAGDCSTETRRRSRSLNSPQSAAEAARACGCGQTLSRRQQHSDVITARRNDERTQTNGE